MGGDGKILAGVNYNNVSGLNIPIGFSKTNFSRTPSGNISTKLGVEAVYSNIQAGQTIDQRGMGLTIAGTGDYQQNWDLNNHNAFTFGVNGSVGGGYYSEKNWYNNARANNVHGATAGGFAEGEVDAGITHKFDNKGSLFFGLNASANAFAGKRNFDLDGGLPTGIFTETASLKLAVNIPLKDGNSFDIWAKGGVGRTDELTSNYDVDLDGHGNWIYNHFTQHEGPYQYLAGGVTLNIGAHKK